MAKAMRSILANKNQSAIEKSQLAAKQKIIDAKLEAKALQALKKEKALKLEQNHAAEFDPISENYNRTLKKIATSAVVKLFNEINSHQQQRNAEAPKRKKQVAAVQEKAPVSTSIINENTSKISFLDMLRTAAKTTQ